MYSVHSIYEFGLTEGKIGIHRFQLLDNIFQTSYTHPLLPYFFLAHFNSLRAKKSSIILALLQQVYISKCIIINDIAASSLFIASVTHSLLESPCPTLVKLEQQQRQHTSRLFQLQRLREGLLSYSSQQQQQSTHSGLWKIQENNPSNMKN